jgi:hypothetical protein
MRSMKIREASLDGDFTAGFVEAARRFERQRNPDPGLT